MLKIGVVGTGHLGKIHVRNLLEMPMVFDLCGFFDTDITIVKEIESEFQLTSFHHLEDLIPLVDALLIASPTHTHFSIAVQALKSGKHVFIEKPVCLTSEESKKLLLYAQEAGVVVQVGHVERFNPALLAATPLIDQPLFIESRRMAPFQKRGTDVSVVYDLMIHDIDIALKITHSNVKKIAAFGMRVLSDSIDFASVHLEFENGCMANITASRVSDVRERKTCFFMSDAHVNVDFLNKEAGRILICKENLGENQMTFDKIPVDNSNAIKQELASFAQSIQDGVNPAVSLEEAHRALQIAELISDQIQASNYLIK
jgi:predicted dehydrogenase